MADRSLGGLFTRILGGSTSGQDPSGERRSTALLASRRTPAMLEALEGRAMMSALLTPTNLQASVSSATAIKLTWADADKANQGFAVWRSENGSDFSLLAKVTSNKTFSYVDSKALSNHSYYYQVSAYKSAEYSERTSIVSAGTPLAIPTGFSAAAIGSTAAVLIKWKGADAAASGYKILRSSDGKNYSLLAMVEGNSSTSYTDSSVSSGLAYQYEIQAMSESNASFVSGVAKAAVALSAPTSVHATAGALSVSLSWSGIDPAAKNYLVLRSTDNKTFSTVATLGPSATEFVDTKVATATAYYYRVRAANTAAPAGTSDLVQTTTLVLAPTSVTAAVAQTNLKVDWKDGNRKGMGYVVLRAAGDGDFSVLATLKAGSSPTYTDSSVESGASYRYEVRAFVGALASDVSSPVSIVAPIGSRTTTITSRYGSEVVITSYSAVESISVSQDGGVYHISINGQEFTQSVLSAGLFIYDRSGGDTITIDSSVSARTTIATFGSAVTTVNSSGASVSAWMDTTDHFNGSGVSHMVSSFAGGVTKAVGASLAVPKDSGTTFRASGSLFSTGPSPDDINQGSVGDCYFLASLSAFADTNPAVVQESAVDLGDGTYVVRYMNKTTPVYVRVSNEVPAGGFAGYKFAHPGSSGALWGVIMEKAYAYYRKGANTYSSISAGWMGEVYTALGVKSTTVGLAVSEMNFYQSISSALSGGFAVTFGTKSAPPQLVGGHAYTVIGVSIEEGVTHYVVRNPWGMKGTGFEDSHGYSSLTFAQMQQNFTAGAIAAA